MPSTPCGGTKVSKAHTLSTIHQTQVHARRPWPRHCSAFFIPTFPVVVETTNPTTFPPCSCGDHRSHELGRCEMLCHSADTTHSANLVVSTPLSTFREIVCLPLFDCLLASCVWSYLPPTPPSSPPPLTPPPHFFYSTPLPHRRQHFHPKPCHTPNPFHPSPLLSPPHSTIIHAPIWCRGR